MIDQRLSVAIQLFNFIAFYGTFGTQHDISEEQCYPKFILNPNGSHVPHVKNVIIIMVLVILVVQNNRIVGVAVVVLAVGVKVMIAVG